MSSRKTIKINPDLFKLSSGGNKTKNKKKINIKPKPNVKPSKLKKELLNKIKDAQKNSEKQDKIDSNTEYNKNYQDNGDSIFDSEFNQSLQFLQELSKSKNNKTLKNRDNDKKDYQNFINLELCDEFKQEIDIPKDNIEFKLKENPNLNNSDTNSDIKSDIKSDKDIPYGCLKNGLKPTYRNWKNSTLKKSYFDEENKDKEKVNIEEKQTFKDRQNKLTIIKNNYKNKDKDKDKDKDKNIQDVNLNDTKLKILDKKTKTSKYRLGKKKDHVSILIKNMETRKKHKEDLTKLKKTSILEIKNYLKKRNLIKNGSNAPNDILRHLYEKAVLSGDITNENSENLIYNYYN